MEAVLGRSSGHGGLVIKKEEIIIKRSDAESSGRDDVDCKQDFALKQIGNTGRPYDEISEDNKRSSPKQKNLISNKQVPETADKERSSIEPDHSMVSSLRRMKQDNDQLESTKAEMGEVREENERLKMYLGKIMKDYQTLQMQFNNIVQQEAAAKNNIHREIEDSELVSLSLGSFSGANEKIKGEKGKIPSTKNAKEINSIHREKQDGHDQEGLSLALDYKYVSEASNKSGATDQGGPAGSNPSAESSFEEPKEEAGETWPPSKILKPAKRSSEQDEVSQVENPAVKKTRVCVRARCDTPTMNDGCQWRKYGQKIAKGNPCPRAYYRCTVAPSCPVRKQVQRCADDMSILITTYEGTHNHQLPVSATAMASTTSAAASMLLSGSSTSSSSAVRPSPPSATAPGFSTFDSLKWNNKVAQLCLPNATTYSSFSSSHPTITLDLTSTPSNSSPFLSKFSNSSPSSSTPNYHHTLYPSTSLSFGSSDNSINNTNNVSWSTSNSFLSYSSSAQQQAYNLKNQIMGTLGLGRQTTPLLQNPSNNNNNVTGYVQNYMQQKISTNPSSGTSISTQVPDSSTIAAATKAITADPTFQSALAAALTSIIGGSCGGGGQVSNILQGDVVQNMKWSPGSGDHHQHQGQFPASTSATELSQTSTKGNVTGCASTFLNKTVAANSQPAGSLMFLSPNSLSFSASKSASASPGDTREQTST